MRVHARVNKSGPSSPQKSHLRPLRSSLAASAISAARLLRAVGTEVAPQRAVACRAAVDRAAEACADFNRSYVLARGFLQQTAAKLHAVANELADALAAVLKAGVDGSDALMEAIRRAVYALGSSMWIESCAEARQRLHAQMQAVEPAQVHLTTLLLRRLAPARTRLADAARRRMPSLLLRM